MRLSSRLAVSPSAENASTGPTISTARYSPNRCGRPRSRSTRQMWLNDSSTLWISEIAEYSSRATPTEPSTPTWMLSTKRTRLVVTSRACWGPRPLSDSSSTGSKLLCTPSALSREKPRASSGANDSRVV